MGDRQETPPPATIVGAIGLACDDRGPKATRPLLLVHGFTGHRDDFAGVRDALASERRVLSPDLRGHGNSGWGPPDRYTFEQAVQDLHGLLDARGVESCHLLGHSMGGMIALRFTLAHHERVASLILMGTSPEAPPGMTTDRFQRAGAFAREHGMQALQARVERAGRERADPIVSRWAERYWSHHRRRYAAMDPEAYAGFGVAMASQTPVVTRLHEIDRPTLVVVGEGDRPFLPGSDRLALGIPSAHRVTLPDSGHHPHEESRDAWLSAIRDHLDRATA